MRVRDSLSYVSVALRAPAKAGGTPRPPKFESPELGGDTPQTPRGNDEDEGPGKGEGEGRGE